MEISGLSEPGWRALRQESRPILSGAARMNYCALKIECSRTRDTVIDDSERSKNSSLLHMFLSTFALYGKSCYFLTFYTGTFYSKLLHAVLDKRTRVTIKLNARAQQV